MFTKLFRKSKVAFTSRIGRMLLFWLLTITLTSLLIINLLHYKNEKDLILHYLKTNLVFISKSCKKEIEEYFRDIIVAINIQTKLKQNIHFLEDLKRNFHGNDTESLYDTDHHRFVSNEAHADLTLFKENYNYQNIYLIDEHGDILYSTIQSYYTGKNIHDEKIKSTKFSKACSKALTDEILVFSDYEFYDYLNNTITGYLANPMTDEAGNKIGVFVLQLSIDEINAIVEDYQLYNTMESYLINEELLMVSRSRFIDNSLMLKKIETENARDFKKDIAKNIDHKQDNLEESISYGKDYRGVDVIGVNQCLNIGGVNLGILTEMDKEEAFLPIQENQEMTLFMITVAGLIVLLVSFFITNKLVTPIVQLTNQVKKVARGDLVTEDIKAPNNEIGEMNESFVALTESFRAIVKQANSIAQRDFSITVTPRGKNDQLALALIEMIITLKDIAETAIAISKGDYTRQITLKNDHDLLGIAINDMVSNLQEMTMSRQNRMWIATGQSALFDTIQKEQSVHGLSDGIITFMAEYLHAQVGALYLNTNYLASDFIDFTRSIYFRMISSYGLTRDSENGPETEFRIGEGLIGQVAADKKMILLDNVPDGHLNIVSGISNTKPRALLIQPLISNDVVIGIIELGSIYGFTEIQCSFIEQVSRNLAVAINLSQSHYQLEIILDKTREQARELQEQQEELRVSNEELEEQTVKLTESEKVLQQQQEELRITNEELEEQTELLKKEKIVVQRKNDEIEKSREELEKKAAQLELISKYKSEFLANMSHELRTPLNSMLILSKLLSENKSGNLTDKQTEFAATIHSSGNELLTLINEILDLSKIEAGRVDIHIEQVDVDDIIMDMNTVFAPIAREKQLEFIIDKHPDFPQSLASDELRLSQIIKNLLSNALKFTHTGSVTLKFYLPEDQLMFSNKSLLDKKIAAIEIIDTGIGITPEKQQLIFEAFQQADTGTSRKYGGTGLGLSISRELIKLLGGEIIVSSEYGAGSVFGIYLPIENADIPTVTKQTPDKKTAIKPPPAAPVAFTKIKPEAVIHDDRSVIRSGDDIILVVEDDINFAKVLLELIHAKNFKGVIDTEGHNCIELTKQYMPRGILLDIYLPDTDGWVLLSQLKDDEEIRHIPVHIISGTDENNRGFQLGAMGFLKKPVSIDQLTMALKKIEYINSKDVKKLLIIEDNKNLNKSLQELLEGQDIEIICVESGKAGFEEINSSSYDCIVLDIDLPDINGMELLKHIRSHEDLLHVPVIIYTGKDLSDDERKDLKAYANRIVIKGKSSPEMLLDLTTLFLHRIEQNLSEEKITMIRKLHNKEMIFKDKKILIVDDDVRNLFALSSILENNDLTVIIAKNGRECLDKLQEIPDIDLILMDIMMPIMDGYEAITEIRKSETHNKIPVIALTAKAMKGDREKCIEVGANDYLPKPINSDQLLSLLRVWLYRSF